VRLECRPAFDYGRARVRPSAAPFGCRFVGTGGPESRHDALLGSTRGAVCDFVLRAAKRSRRPVAGRRRRARPALVPRSPLRGRVPRTLRFWQDGFPGATITGAGGRWSSALPRAEAVDLRATGRSCRAHDESAGAQSAGAQLGLRYTWIRDAAFTCMPFSGWDSTRRPGSSSSSWRTGAGLGATRASSALRVDGGPIPGDHPRTTSRLPRIEARPRRKRRARQFQLDIVATS